MIGDSPLVNSYLQARHYGPYDNLPINRVAIHYMGTSEKKDTAENCAAYFHTMSDGRVASAHYCVDVDTIVQCVRENNLAYHAPPNTHSIGIEHAGTEQTKEQWGDDYSRTMLKLSAKLCADICKRHDIPVVKLSVQDLRDGKRGICGHVDVSNAFHQTDHGDPGKDFPWDSYLAWVRNEGGNEMSPEEMAHLDERFKALKGGLDYVVADAAKRQVQLVARLDKIIELLEKQRSSP